MTHHPPAQPPVGTPRTSPSALWRRVGSLALAVMGCLPTAAGIVLLSRAGDERRRRWQATFGEGGLDGVVGYVAGGLVLLLVAWVCYALATWLSGLGPTLVGVAQMSLGMVLLLMSPLRRYDLVDAVAPGVTWQMPLLSIVDAYVPHGLLTGLGLCAAGVGSTLARRAGRREATRTT